MTGVTRCTGKFRDVPALLPVVYPRENTGENGKNRSHDGKKVQCLWREAKLSTKAESCLDVVTSVLVKRDSGSFLPSSEAKAGR